MEELINKKWKEFHKNYCANRPCEPYSSGSEPEMWCAIASYAEDNIKQAFFQGYALGKADQEKARQINSILRLLEFAKGELEEIPYDCYADILDFRWSMDATTEKLANYRDGKTDEEEDDEEDNNGT